MLIFWRMRRKIFLTNNNNTRSKKIFIFEPVSIEHLIIYIYIYLNISCKYINIRNLNITRERRSKMATTFNNSRDSMYRTRMYCLNEFPNKLFPLWLSCFPLTIREPTSSDNGVSFAITWRHGIFCICHPAENTSLRAAASFLLPDRIAIFLSFARTPLLVLSNSREIKINREIINTLLQLWI